MPTVSVIVPAYGHARLILETLESVFAQSYRDFELIVINDGSPDDTAKVLAPLVASGTIRYFEQPNQGVAVTRNFGISQAAGEYIALLDDDDLWLPDKLEWQVAAMDDRTLVGIGGEAEYLTPCGIERERPITGTADYLELKQFFKGNPFNSPGQVLFRKAAFEKGARFDPEIWGADDLDFWMELTKHGKILKISRLCLQYRIHDSNASRNHLKMMVNIRKVIDKRLRTLHGTEFKKCRRAGYRWLYADYATGLIWKIKADFFSSDPNLLRGISISLVLARTFCSALFHDKWIGRSLFRKFVKASLGR
jgi:glycosyltransferase involved in cell wall biosynthesis